MIVDGAGGVKLYGQWWRPRGVVRGVVVVQHGLKDHGDRYAALADRLATAGFTVYALDLRGHGRSAGPRTAVGRFDDYVDDLAAWVTRARAAAPGMPVFVMGHSMGGAIAARYAEAHAGELAGVILSAPALGLDLAPIQVGAARLAGTLNPGVAALDLPEDDFSREPAVVASMKRDPLISHPKGPAHTAAALLTGIEAVWADAARMTAPLLILHGTEDRLTAPAASRDFVARVPATDKRLVVFDGAWHVLLGDRVADDVTAEIVGFVEAHAGGAVDPDVAARLRKDPSAPAELVGDRLPSATGVELAGVVGVNDGDATSGALRASLSIGRAVAWHADLALRVRDGVGVEVLPAGAATRLGRAGQLAVAAGVAAGWPARWSDVRVPVQLSLDLPLGPTHLLARAQAAWVVAGVSPPTRALGVADEVGAVVGLRLGGDRDYWMRVSAGAGPFVGATWSRRGDVDVWGVAVGVHAWGAN